MDYRKFDGSIYVRFNRGDEIIKGIMEICKKENILSATYSGIGCCSEATIASYIPEKNDFLEHKKKGVLELVSLNGNISADDNDQIYHHTHALFSYHNCLPPVIKAPCANCSGREPYFLSDSCSGTI